MSCVCVHVYQYVYKNVCLHVYGVVYSMCVCVCVCVACLTLRGDKQQSNRREKGVDQLGVDRTLVQASV